MFNLAPPDDDISVTENDSIQPTAEITEITEEILGDIDKIESALPAVRGLEASDSEMDELADLAKESYQNLMDLGMNVDSRYSSEIFSVASNMLGHAISAKNAKINKKLKMIELQLKKLRLDQTADPQENIPTGQGHVLDRNELLKQLLDNTRPKP